MIKKSDAENAEFVCEIDGTKFYKIGDLIGARWHSNSLIPRDGRFIGYNWEVHRWAVKLDKPLNGQELVIVSDYVLR